MKRIQLCPKCLKVSGTPVLAVVILIATTAVAMAILPQTQSAFNASRLLPRAIDLYKNWLEGPVSYIINPRESVAFESLTSNAEREMFLRQFWERRNPSPGGRTNAFKEEFFRRVDYADAHFAAGYPGWKSDRGHMYILYGPPDEIQYHPTSTPYHFSVWKYQHLGKLGNDVVFVFVDLTGNGDYRIASPPWK
ncbi:MAG TPA: GWxTD domain-containing protein [Terriglobia bacterium]|nr:GWxTD domain-containing protein [Terriglobia bacterium]